MQKDILKNWFFRQSPDKVWDFLTQPELIEQWLMKSDFRAEPGHRFRFSYTPKEGSDLSGRVDCEVLEVMPFTRLSYSWSGNSKDGSKPFNSKVEWTLLPKENGTELQLKHNGFVRLEDYTTHNAGWDICLKRMDAISTQKTGAL